MLDLWAHLGGLWVRLADLCVPPWAVGLSGMPGHDRVACVDFAIQHARRTGFPHGAGSFTSNPNACDWDIRSVTEVPAPPVSRHLRVLPDLEPDA